MLNFIRIRPKPIVHAPCLNKIDLLNNLWVSCIISLLQLKLCWHHCLLNYKRMRSLPPHLITPHQHRALSQHASSVTIPRVYLDADVTLLVPNPGVWKAGRISGSRGQAPYSGVQKRGPWWSLKGEEPAKRWSMDEHWQFCLSDIQRHHHCSLLKVDIRNSWHEWV